MLLFFFRILAHFPLRVLHAIGAALSWMVYLCAPGYRRRLKENITRAGYASYLNDAISQIGKTMSELPFVWGAPMEKVLASVQTDNWEIVERALAAGKGIIFFTPHLGCYEVTAQLGAAHMDLTVMYRPPGNATHKPIFVEGRTRGTLKLAATNLNGVRAMAKALKRNEAIGLLPDHVPKLGEGAWAEFFGRPAYTMTLAAKLKQMSGAAIIMTYAERLPHGQGYMVHFYPFEEEMGDTPEQQARAINSALEKLVAHCPAQYFWSYNRFRTPRPPDPSLDNVPEAK
jgi:Kdo2-lipid IVA lauroyltransferase/acyltransferase